MAEAADALPFSVANILKDDVPRGASGKRGKSYCNASKALTLAERLAGKFWFIMVAFSTDISKQQNIHSALIGWLEWKTCCWKVTRVLYHWSLKTLVKPHR